MRVRSTRKAYSVAVVVCDLAVLDNADMDDVCLCNRSLAKSRVSCICSRCGLQRSCLVVVFGPLLI